MGGKGGGSGKGGDGGKGKIPWAPWHRGWSSPTTADPAWSPQDVRAWPPLRPGLQTPDDSDSSWQFVGVRGKSKGQKGKYGHCGCARNEARFYFCKRCGALKGEAMEPTVVLADQVLKGRVQPALGRAEAKTALSQACAKNESLQAQFDAQQQLVVQFRSERAEANEEHSRLVRLLAEKPPEEPSVPQLPAEVLFDQAKLEKFFDIDFGNMFKLDGDTGLGTEDAEQLPKRAGQLKDGSADLANIFSEAKAKMDAAKLEHAGLVDRLQKQRGGRALACSVEIPAPPPFTVFSAYLYHAEGLSGRNPRLLSDIGALLSQRHCSWLLGADFNMEPRVIEGPSFVAELRVSLVFPKECTRYPVGAPATFDYFVVCAGLSKGIGRIDACLDTVHEAVEAADVKYAAKGRSEWTCRKLTGSFLSPVDLPMSVTNGSNGLASGGASSVFGVAKRALDPEVDAARRYKHMTSAFLVLLWLLYIALSCWQALANQSPCD
ncbi:unnamed protein product [Prorocentrum cordatum]|uniref:Uncharacterized protein n=1 Tax=Prorocentrum cordatum TaxID=2364126 RepID=A0ABN9QNH0_9DINO|nr:unnamed protein product [Polarella glacialis]